MTHAQTAASSSSPNFQLIFNNALKAYEKNTKRDLLAHPLAAQLQACDSPSAILLVLQEQARELNESRTNDERLTTWLAPTVNVLYALSGVLGEGVGLVCFNTWDRLRSPCLYYSQVFSPAKVVFAGIGVFLLVHSLVLKYLRTGNSDIEMLGGKGRSGESRQSHRYL
jgi:hypothetical protein